MHFPWAVLQGPAIALGVGVVLFLLLLPRIRRRRGVRERFVAFVREKYPRFELVRVTPSAIFLRSAELDQGQMNLANLYRMASQTKTPEEEREVFEKFGSVLGDMEADAGPMSLETHGARLYPMLAPPAKRQSMPADANMPFTALPALGLEVLYVLDHEHSVTYITEKHRADLGVSVEELHARCMENLRGRFTPDMVREQLAKPSLTGIALGDGYDATRLLVIPEGMEQGQVAAAMIPDRDTLLFMSAGEDCDWDKLAGACPPSSPQLLLKRPVKVTKDGFELM